MPRSYYRSPELEADIYAEYQAEEERIDREEAAHRNRADLCPICSRVARCRCEDDPADRGLAS